MLPNIIVTVLDELSRQNKELLEYKVFGQNSDLTTIILKYGDHDMASDFVYSGHAQSKYRRPPYRTSSQLYRDHGRALHDWENKRNRRDSGVFTPGQGPFLSSMNKPTGTVFQQFDDSNENFDDVHVPMPPYNLHATLSLQL